MGLYTPTPPSAPTQDLTVLIGLLCHLMDELYGRLPLLIETASSAISEKGKSSRRQRAMLQVRRSRVHLMTTMKGDLYDSFSSTFSLCASLGVEPSEPPEARARSRSLRNQAIAQRDLWARNLETIAELSTTWSNLAANLEDRTDDRTPHNLFSKILQSSVASSSRLRSLIIEEIPSQSQSSVSEVSSCVKAAISVAECLGRSGANLTQVVEFWTAFIESNKANVDLTWWESNEAWNVLKEYIDTIPENRERALTSLRVASPAVFEPSRVVNI